MNISVTFNQFSQLAKKGKTIPVFAEILGDLETPVSSFLKVNPKAQGFILESVESGRSQGRYSFIGIQPSSYIVHKNKTTKYVVDGRVKKKYLNKDPLEILEKTLKQYKYVANKSLPRFCGGAVGYLGYDCNSYFDKVPPIKGKEELPSLLYVFAEELLVFDHFRRTIKIVLNTKVPSSANTKSLRAKYNSAINRIAEIKNLLEQPHSNFLKPLSFKDRKLDLKNVKSNFTATEFNKRILKIKDYIRKGDAIQVVLSQRFLRSVKSTSFDVYRILRALNPSPYMFYLNCFSFEMVGSSPETHVRCDENGMVELKPIAGTRPRGSSMREDKRLAKDLLEDPKERAEHVMLVDLGRNDLGRVCEVGSIQIPEFMVIEYYSHVMHIVSKVIGKLKKNVKLSDVIRSTFPAGTVSGAPKVRAMQIIAESEPQKRGPYAGLVGYLSFNGYFDSCITIRTIIFKDQKAYVQAGAGIVADSKPEKEWQETKNKAMGLLKAIEITERGAL